ncbi:hypothetical protein GEMRC1_013836 [Eukaryota sp. GEM-RC1]
MTTIQQIDSVFNWSLNVLGDSATWLEPLQSCLNFINNESLFSTNEDMEDVSTNHILYFLVDFFLGHVYMNAMSSDRLSSLSSSQAYFSSFLQRIYQYKLISENQLSEFYVSDFKVHSIPPSSKREFLQKLMIKSKEISQKVNDSFVDVTKADEEDIRNHYILKLHHAFLLTAKSLHQIEQEHTMLKTVRQVEKTEDRDLLKEYQEEKNRMSAQKTLPPRQLLKDQVFDVSHRLWTISSEEGDRMEAERIFARARKEEEGKRAAEQVVRMMEGQHVYVEAREDEEECKRKKDSAWEDWKDDNPKGSGNVMR